jgi:hypothetical protein
MDTPKGLIILLHNGFTKIAVDEVLAALPSGWHSLQREVKEINYSQLLELQKLYDTGYEQYALEHKRYFTNAILPVLNARPDYKVIYFGMAPIPLCIDLGHLFHNYRNIDIYQRHHVSKEWYINLEAEQDDKNLLQITGLPDQQQKGISDALIRLSISHNINSDDTYEILPNAAEIDIQLDHASEDAITSSKKMTEVGESIKKAFDELSNNRSGLKTVHFFASIPCGVAFLAGTKISPNIHSYIQTYQYSRTKEPKYKKALLIKALLRPERKIVDKDKKKANELRELCNEELTKKVKQYNQYNKDMSVGRKWYEGLVPGVNNSIMNTKFWIDLPALYETSLKDDSFDFDTEVVNDGFYWRMNKWFVDDNFFISLNNRLSNTEDILKAVRLFLFHEAVHYKKHKLTDLTSVNIGSFPKVLETADYQADVYAIMNEYAYHLEMKGKIQNQKQFFMDTIKVATETMWSFDDAGIELEEIQIRRLNRYMIWYWIYARIENEGNSIDEIISILEEKPVIELNGLKTKEENNRFFFELEKRKDQPLELAIFYKNQLIRDGSATNMPLESLINGIKEMKGELILNVMRSFLNR